MLGQHLSLLMSKNTSTNSPYLKFGDVLWNRHRFQGLAIREWITLNASSYFMGNSKQQLSSITVHQYISIMMAMCLNGRNLYKGIECMTLICFWLFKMSSWKKESPLKLREEKKMGKEFSFIQISSMKEETVEFSHQK